MKNEFPILQYQRISRIRCQRIETIAADRKVVLKLSLNTTADAEAFGDKDRLRQVSE